MQAYKRRCVFAESHAPGSFEQADKLQLLDCADLRPCLFQLVEQPGCADCGHELTRTFLPQRTQGTQRQAWPRVNSSSPNLACIRANVCSEQIVPAIHKTPVDHTGLFGEGMRLRR